MPSLVTLEDLIGHHFTTPALLFEAITHASCQQTRENLSPSYERLEFLGDAVLDLVVTPKLFEHPRKLRHWELHRVHEALVNAHYLGFCCMSLTEHARKFDVINAGTARESHMQLKEGTTTFHLYDFLRAGGEVRKAKARSISRFETVKDDLTKSLTTDSMYPWPELVTMRPEKFISNMVESIMGALYLDTRGDLGACERFAEKLRILPTMRRILDEGVETAFPKERLGILADREEVQYASTRREDASTKQRSWECVVKVGGVEILTVDGYETREAAEVRGAHIAAQRLASSGIQRGSKRRKLELRNGPTQSGAEADDMLVS